MIRKLENAERWNCFKELRNKVKGLWMDGEVKDSDLSKSFAIVGSRRISQYGRQVVEKLVSQLVSFKLPIISGFMYGTDQTVHKAVIQAGGITVAVLGWGIKYEKVDEEDNKLWRNIVDTGGAVVSEWEYQTPAYWTFPARDRIMAALSTDIYVVEAAEKSGALITAQIASDLHKNVWAVPGSIFSTVSAGTNSLIAEGKAKMWLPRQQTELKFTNETLYKQKDTKVFSSLVNDALTADEIAKKHNLPITEVLQELMMLTLQGKVVEREGKYQRQT